MKKKKVLLLSTIYPAKDIQISNNTSVVHYFAMEWVKQGHDVLVVHNYPVYLRILHWIAHFADKIIASKFNTSVTAVYQNRDEEFVMDGVKVCRMPLFKPLPRFGVPRKVLERQVNKIADWCKKNDFTPDVISAHNFYPHVEMVNKLKERFFPNAKTCVVVHKQRMEMLRFIEGSWQEQIRNVDVWGYRSLPLKREFENATGYVPPVQFQCYSGIPGHFVAQEKSCDISKPIKNFVYVGSFIRRKYPEKILLALKECGLDDFRLDYVGDGANRPIIENIVKREKWQDNVTLHGFVAREQVPSFIARAQCFIMISEEETFGLVYLEAMSMGCITIASKNEGMEGIIQDGVNGFLCKAGDEHELAQIIDKINLMPIEDLRSISENARKTARHLTDENVARIYLESIVNADVAEKDK